MVLIRALSADYSSFQILFVRTLVGFALLAPSFRQTGISGLRTHRLGMHMTRAVFAYLGLLGLFVGIASIPLSDVVALSFTQPIFIVVLATLFMSERLGAMRMLAVAAGFTGVLVIVRPGFETIGIGTIATLSGAVAYAASNICIKRLMTTETPALATMYVNLLMCPMAAIPAFFFWVAPSPIDIALLIGCGVTGTLGAWFVTHAYASADMTAVVPFDFLRLPLVMAGAWLFFSEETDALTVVGAVIIFSGAWGLARSETRRQPVIK